MTPRDPLATVWDALERRGYEPHGRPYNFRARCPGHDGGNRDALHVSEGCDGRVLLHCFSRPDCDHDRILAALDLTAGDLFPAGHRRARRLRIEPAKRSDLASSARVIVDTLAAFDVVGMPWQAMIASCCPYCGAPGAWLRASSASRPFADCASGCTAEQFAQALAGRVADQRQAK